VFTPKHHLRAQVIAARRGPRQATSLDDPPSTRHAVMAWAQGLKRVFKIEIETCETCGGHMKIIATTPP